MKRNPNRNFSDMIFTALSVGLAGSCILFAGYMIVRLQNMENPAADLGLNFPDMEKRDSAMQAVLVDPLVTSAVDRPEEARLPSPQAVVQPYTKDSPVLNYRLLSVIDGVAFIEVTKLKGKEIWPVGEGSELPGVGRVNSITKVVGRWQVAAGGMRIAAEPW